MTKRQLEARFESNLKPSGFKNKSSTWYRHEAETIVLVDLQKSNYGNQFYINVAAWLKPLGEADLPKEHQCHLRVRVTSAYPDLKPSMERLFDLEDASLSDSDREEEIDRLFAERILPLTLTMQSIASIAAACRNGVLSKALITRPAQELISKVEVQNTGCG